MRGNFLSIALTTAAALTCVAGLTGCASMKPGMGFDDVRQGASDRTGMRVHWNNGSAEDQEVAAAVSAMLDKDLTADAAAQVALLNNHELQAVYEELNLAQADVVQAGLLRNPILSGEVRRLLSSSTVRPNQKKTS